MHITYNRTTVSLRLLSCTALTAAFLMMQATAAHAQSASSEDVAQTEDLDTATTGNMIVVTARKRSETLLEVPASVAVLNAEVLDRQGIQDFEDLAFAVPNVLITENTNLSGRTSVTIRGIPGRAGIYVDDVFVGDSAGINTLLLDTESVQILRGPQGTLFGRNAMSGAINTITRRPTDELNGYAELQLGEYGLAVARGAINGGITEGVSAKLAVGYRTRETYETVANQGQLQAEDALAFQAQIKLEPTDNITIVLNGDYLDETNQNSGLDVVRDFGFPGDVYGIAATDASPTDRRHPGQNVINTASREMYNLWGRIDIDFDFATLTSITNKRDIEFNFVRDGDNSAFDYIRGVQPVDFEQFSQEVRLTSNDDGPFEWLLGAYYFKDDRSSSDANTIGGDAFLNQNDGFAPFIEPFFPGGVAGVVTPNTLAANPILGGFDPTLGFVLSILQAQGNTEIGTTTNTQTSSNESLAFWASGTFQPIDQIEITAGVRYTDESQGGSFGAFTDGDILPLFGVVAFPSITLPNRSDNNISFNGSISYFPSDDVTLYASYAEGFRSGGYNLSPSGVPGTPEEEAADRAFDSETVSSYEIGLKSVLFDGRASLNGAVFYSEYNDFQRSFLRATPTGFINETLNTDATIYGAEVDLAVKLTDNFSLSASYGYQDSSYDDYQNAPINSTQGLEIVDLTGQALPFVPKHSATMGFQYGQQISGDWSLRVTTDVQYRSSYQVTDSVGADPETLVRSSVVVNPSIGFENERHQFKVILRANNLFNETYRTGVDFNTFDGSVGQAISAPRVVSVQLRKDF